MKAFFTMNINEVLQMKFYKRSFPGFTPVGLTDPTTLLVLRSFNVAGLGLRNFNVVGLVLRSFNVAGLVLRSFNVAESYVRIEPRMSRSQGHQPPDAKRKPQSHLPTKRSDPREKAGGCGRSDKKAFLPFLSRRPS